MVNEAIIYGAIANINYKAEFIQHLFCAWDIIKISAGFNSQTAYGLQLTSIRLRSGRNPECNRRITFTLFRKLSAH